MNVTCMACEEGRLDGHALVSVPHNIILEPNFVEALKVASEEFRKHPFWNRLEGTPWENDAPVIAAKLMCTWLRLLV